MIFSKTTQRNQQTPLLRGYISPGRTHSSKQEKWHVRHVKEEVLSGTEQSGIYEGYNCDAIAYEDLIPLLSWPNKKVTLSELPKKGSRRRVITKYTPTKCDRPMARLSPSSATTQVHIILEFAANETYIMVNSAIMLTPSDRSIQTCSCSTVCH